MKMGIQTAQEACVDGAEDPGQAAAFAYQATLFIHKNHLRINLYSYRVCMICHIYILGGLARHSRHTVNGKTADSFRNVAAHNVTGRGGWKAFMDMIIL